MNKQVPRDPDGGAHLRNCRTDPGVLTENDAIRAISIHHRCPPQCLVLGRALDTLNKKYTSPEGRSSTTEPAQRSATGPIPSEEFSELDYVLADKLRELARLHVRMAEKQQSP